MKKKLPYKLRSSSNSDENVHLDLSKLKIYSTTDCACSPDFDSDKGHWISQELLHLTEQNRRTLKCKDMSTIPEIYEFKLLHASRRSMKIGDPRLSSKWR